MTSPTTPAPPDPDKGVYIFSSGRKGSGKSVVCRYWFDDYPYDRLVIDVTHDLTADFRRDGVDFTELRGGLDMPARLPAHRPGQPRTYVYQPDMGNPAAVDDMDRVVGLGIDRGPTLIWCDEYGQQTTGSKSPPNIKRVLHHGRHDHLTMLFACPRPMDINPITIGQSDKVYTFQMANPDDRDRVAKNIGWAPKEFEEINAEIGRLNAANPGAPYWHSMYDQQTNELWIMPPLPVRARGRRPIGDPGELAAAAELDDRADEIRRARAERNA
jgi:hypothetical protein